MPDFDANATTPIHHAALAAMVEVYESAGRNPSSPHQAGRSARRFLDDARERIAGHLDCFPDEIIFTSGATEANNGAIAGLAGDTPGHVIVSAVEHPCVIEPVVALSQRGWDVDFIMPNSEGMIEAASVLNRVGPKTRFAAVMLANHETGAINPVAAMAECCPLHCDAAQAIGKIPVSFRKLKVTTLSVSGHKFRGPVGVGALLVKRGTKLTPLIRGGPQQDGRRSGTEPIALVVGMAVALDEAVKTMDVNRDRAIRMRERFITAFASMADFNGPADVKNTLPHVVNVSFRGIRSDVLLVKLDLAGITASAGAACSSGAMLPSPVLKSMGIEGDRLKAAVRFSWSPAMTDEEFDEAIRSIRRVVADITPPSPSSAGERG